jgi:hypothetical protein
MSSVLGGERCCRAAWLDRPFYLVSLKDVLMANGGSEFHFEPLTNLLWLLGRLEQPLARTMIAQVQVAAELEIGIEWLERYGFGATVSAVRDVLDIVRGRHPSNDPGQYITVARTVFMHELERTLILPIEYSAARHYREPRRGWEGVIERFPGVVSDVEEANKCFALARYAAAVFHSMQVVEVGVIALGNLIEVSDPKAGWDAVTNRLRVLAKDNFRQLTDAQ